MNSKKKIGIISCEDAVGWGGEEGLCNYIVEKFQNIDSNIEYVHFYAVTGSLPLKAEAQEFAGFVISGSHYSVNDGYGWISNLTDFVRYIHDFAPGPRLFGICFGHQLIAKALGGKVENNGTGKFVWGTEEVEINHSEMHKELCKRSFGGDQKSLKIMQSHGERVSVLPKAAVSLGKSKTCNYEILSYGDLMMSTQGHPELTKEAMVGNILPRLKKNGIISDAEDEAARKLLTDEDHTTMMQFVYNFLTLSVKPSC